MHNSDYLREQAEGFRREAETERDAAERQDLIECADVCEEVADYLDRLRASG